VWFGLANTCLSKVLSSASANSSLTVLTSSAHAVAAAFTPLDEGVDPISVFDAAEARPSRTAAYQL